MLIITFIVCGVFSIGNPSDEPHCPPNGLPDCPPGAYWILFGFMDILENLAVLFFQMTFQWNFYPIIVIEIKKAATQKSSIVLIFWYDCFIYKHWMFVFFFWSEKFKIVRKHFHSRYSIFFCTSIDWWSSEAINLLTCCLQVHRQCPNFNFCHFWLLFWKEFLLSIYFNHYLKWHTIL